MSDDENNKDLEVPDEYEIQQPMRPSMPKPAHLKGPADPMQKENSRIKLVIQKLANGTITSEDATNQLSNVSAYTPEVQQFLDSRLRFAATMGNHEACTGLLKLGAAINSTDEDGNTSLHLAVTPGKEHHERQDFVLRVLFEWQCDADIKNNAGITAKTHVSGVTTESLINLVRSYDVYRKLHPSQRPDDSIVKPGEDEAAVAEPLPPKERTHHSLLEDPK